ncbi:MAG: hypothetical protein WDN04_09435 [Rhodospirillales bacterium]
MLTGSAGGSADLTGTNNVAALGDFTATDFTLLDTPDLAVHRHGRRRHDTRHYRHRHADHSGHVDRRQRSADRGRDRRERLHPDRPADRHHNRHRVVRRQQRHYGARRFLPPPVFRWSTRRTWR